PVVTALYRVQEKAPNAVAVVLVVFRRVDAPLGGHAVGPPRRVLNAEVEDVVSQFTQRRGRRGTRQTGSHDDNGVAPFVGGVDQFHRRFVVGPLVLDGPFRDLGVQYDLAIRSHVDTLH